jgi:hypothetical protein
MTTRRTRRGVRIAVNMLVGVFIGVTAATVYAIGNPRPNAFIAIILGVFSGATWWCIAAAVDAAKQREQLALPAAPCRAEQASLTAGRPAPLALPVAPPRRRPRPRQVPAGTPLGGQS